MIWTAPGENVHWMPKVGLACPEADDIDDIDPSEVGLVE